MCWACSSQEAEEVDDADDLGAVDLTEQATAAAAAGEGEEEDEEDYGLFAAGMASGGGSAVPGAAGGGGGSVSSGADPGAAAGAVAGGGESGAPADRQVLASSIDPTLWKLEVERVAPRLRLTLPADARDWRQHLEAAHGHADVLLAGWPDTKGALQRMAADVGGMLERLATREGTLNAQFADALSGYAAARRQLGEAQEDVAVRGDGVSAKDGELHRLSAALEEVKAALDERGSSLSDASPLVRIKAAISTLRSELGRMEVRIGVVNHTLMQQSLSDKQAVLRDVAARTADGKRGTRG